MRFIWDPAKAILNYAKHGVAFGEAITAFDDPMGHYVPDPNHPERGNLTGLSSTEQLLFVVHVELLTEDPPAIRLISARKASGADRTKYMARLSPATTQKSQRKPKQRSRRERRDSTPPKPKRRRSRHEEE